MPRTALITGGNRGLGRASVLALRAAGTEVVYTYRTDPGEPVDAVALPLTVGDLDSYPDFVTSLRTVLHERFGRGDLDVLVHNAGVGIAGSVASTTVEAFDELMDVHVRGMFFLTQALLPLVADGGRIVTVSTGLTRFTGDGTYAAYGALKGAVEVFTRYLAHEVGPRGITANVVAPGPVGTGFDGGRLRDDERVRAYLGGQAALGRIGEPDDVARVVTALAGEDLGWVTGQRIEASGGMLL